MLRTAQATNQHPILAVPDSHLTPQKTEYRGSFLSDRNKAHQQAAKNYQSSKLQPLSAPNQHTFAAFVKKTEDHKAAGTAKTNTHNYFRQDTPVSRQSLAFRRFLLSLSRVPSSSCLCSYRSSIATDPVRHSNPPLQSIPTRHTTTNNTVTTPAQTTPKRCLLHKHKSRPNPNQQASHQASSRQHTSSECLQPDPSATSNNNNEMHNHCHTTQYCTVVAKNFLSSSPFAEFHCTCLLIAA